MEDTNQASASGDLRCPNCQGQYSKVGPSQQEVIPERTKIKLPEAAPEHVHELIGTEDYGCSQCLLFEELAPALRLSVGTLRNWKYEGFLTPVHAIGRRPHFQIVRVREELRRNGKIR
jgi:hypothetical protein